MLRELREYTYVHAFFALSRPSLSDVGLVAADTFSIGIFQMVMLL